MVGNCSFLSGVGTVACSKWLGTESGCGAAGDSASIGGTFTARVFVGFDPQYPFRRQLTRVPVTFEVNNGNDEIQGELFPP